MLQVASQFCIEGKPQSCDRYGAGHINQTYLLLTEQGAPYILQKINHDIFTDIDGLMSNISAVTRHLSKKEKDTRRVLTIVPTLDGKNYYQDTAGGYWRIYIYVQNSLCLQAPENLSDFHSSGLAFGNFQRQLTDFDAKTLHNTIPDFHNTPNRFEKFVAAVKNDSLGRLSKVQKEVEFALFRQERAGRMQAMLRENLLKTRVTHNDTKLNNVLLESTTREPLCVIDLDTVMPGLAGHDFGDSIRFGASTAAEDERNLELVSLSLPMFEAYAHGFLTGCGNQLTKAEIDTLPEGAWAMTFECGIRFLTDYLNGDVYFHTSRDHHNLDRCRTQFKLVEEIENKWPQIEEIMRKLV